jgi:hypothetical protein
MDNVKKNCQKLYSSILEELKEEKEKATISVNLDKHESNEKEVSKFINKENKTNKKLKRKKSNNKSLQIGYKSTKIVKKSNSTINKINIK